MYKDKDLVCDVNQYWNKIGKIVVNAGPINSVRRVEYFS
jgi:hypothetical protein